MHDSLDTFFTTADQPLDTFDSWAKRHRPQAVADHICYKCGSAKEFDQVRKLFERQSAFIYQSIISDRRIAIIKFTEFLPTDLGPIGVLELSDQKPDGSQKSGFDHVEIYPKTPGMDDLAAALAESGSRFTYVERPHHSTYDLKLDGGFKIRIEPEPLITKVREQEFR